MAPETETEEISQEVFLAVIMNIDHFQAGCQLQTWLFRIAANKAADFRERQHAAKRGGGRLPLSLQAEDPVTGLSLDPPSSAPPPDLALLSFEQAGLVHQALDNLE